MHDVVRNHWLSVFTEVGVPRADLNYLSQATILGESIFYKLD
jgi:serine/threonine-protein kinase HipA